MEPDKVAEMVSDYLADWINGNRQAVMKHISHLTPHRAAMIGALLYAAMSPDEREMFVKMILSRIE